MTEIEQKALALLNEVCVEMGLEKVKSLELDMPGERALVRAIEQHEQFKREVSDAVVKATHTMATGKLLEASCILAAFILPKPVDPLVEAWDEAWGELNDKAAKLETFRAALAKRGLEVRKIEG